MKLNRKKAFYCAEGGHYARTPLFDEKEIRTSGKKGGVRTVLQNLPKCPVCGEDVVRVRYYEGSKS